MKYRVARLLKKGDWIIRKEDGRSLEVYSVELFGQYQKVKVNCIIPSSQDGSEFVAGTTIRALFNDEIE
jgi:hypothetical protein